MKKVMNKYTAVLVAVVMVAALLPMSSVSAVTSIYLTDNGGTFTVDAGEPLVLSVGAETYPPNQEVEFAWFRGTAQMTDWSTSNSTYKVNTTFGPYYVVGSETFYARARIKGTLPNVESRPYNVTVNGMLFLSDKTQISKTGPVGYRTPYYDAEFTVRNEGNIFGSVDFELVSCKVNGFSTTEPWCKLLNEFTVLTPNGQDYSSGLVKIRPNDGLPAGVYEVIYKVKSAGSPALNELNLKYTFTVQG